MADSNKFVMIDCFAPQSLKKVAKKIVDEYFKNDSESAIQIGDDVSKKIPLILCEDREPLKRNLGLAVPYEFIVTRNDLLPVFVPNPQANSSPKLVREFPLTKRLGELKRRYSEGINEAQLQDWFAGLFRKYLLLDTTAHGNEGFVEADKPNDKILQESVKADTENKEENKEAKLLRHRFLDAEKSETDPLEGYKKLLEKIYAARFAAIKVAIESCEAKNLHSIYTDRELQHTENGHVAVEHANRLPRAYGDRAKFVTPTGKLNLLLIDDKVKESPFYWLNPPADEPEPKKNQKDFKSTICEDDWNLLRDIFNVETLPINDGDDISSVIRAKMGPGNASGFTYDLILVDLCLGGAGDLSGYAAIRKIQMYRPGVPVVVYSRFDDMEHISRAFREGAKWFLVKGQEAKLPRHVLKLLKNPGWHKEWQEIASSKDAPEFLSKNDAFRNRFMNKPEWQYLTYKVLERFPGREINMTPMGGGISGAVTFRAEKGEKDENGRFLQTPHIVKIDKEHAMRMEYERYTRFIRPYMANESGRVEQPERVINREAAAIVYTFAGKQDDAHVLESMGSMLKDDLMSRSACDFNKYREALDWIFDDILPKIHKVKLNDEHTSYPNALFGEVPPGEWLNNYRARMVPTQRVVITEDFVCQQKDKPHWEFHDTADDPMAEGMECLEVYDKNKNVVLFAGDRCDFIARFRRRLMPGMTLWLPDNPCNGSDNGRYESHWLNCVLAKNGNTPAVFFDIVTKLLWESPFVTSYEDLMDVYAELRSSLEKEANGCSCPTGIVHGDLNLNNIMLEARKHAPKESDRDVNKTVSDVWFIDFARTRRDIVAHDFNVFFTSTLGLLFDRSLIKRYNEFFDPTSWLSYFDNVASVFAVFVREAVSSKSKDLKAVPDEIADDPRLVLVYRILRRSREAALKYMSEKTYMLTTALACLGAMKIFIKKKDCLEMAAAYFAAAKICCDCYCRGLGK